MVFVYVYIKFIITPAVTSERSAILKGKGGKGKEEGTAGVVVARVASSIIL